MNISTIFVNDHGVPRSGWRVVIYLAAYALATAVMAGVVFSVARIPQNGFGDDALYYAGITALVTLFPAIVMGWLCERRLEGLPFRALGVAFSADWFRHLVSGLMLGAATLSVVIVIAMSFGHFTFALNTVPTGEIWLTLARSLVVLSVAAAWEEVFFRGYVFQTLTRARLEWLAITLTAAFFGLVHIMNPSAGSISTVNTILAGIWLGFAYLKTRDLWFPFGIHLMWNWLQGAFFGIEVSGLTDIFPAPLLKEFDAGPEWITGGNYGIEGSAACTFAIIISIAAIRFLPRPKPEGDQLALSTGDSSKRLDLERNIDGAG